MGNWTKKTLSIEDRADAHASALALSADLTIAIESMRAALDLIESEARRLDKLQLNTVTQIKRHLLQLKHASDSARDKTKAHMHKIATNNYKQPQDSLEALDIKSL